MRLRANLTNRMRNSRNLNVFTSVLSRKKHKTISTIYTEATWKMSQTGQSPETTEQQLIALQDQLSGLLARYTPEHPDVIKVKHQIEELKKHMAEVPKISGPGSASTHASAIEPPQMQQLRAKLRQDEVSISDLAKRQSQI